MIRQFLLAEYATFDMANMLAFSKVNLPQFGLVFVGAISSAVGLCSGTVIPYAVVKKKHRI